MLDGIKQLIERLKAQKAALHPEQSSKPARCWPPPGRTRVAGVDPLGVLIH